MENNKYEFKGTKGKWGVDRIGRNYDSLYIGVMKPDNKSIERIVTHIELSEHYKPDVNAEHLANAYLIAAAPDLLKSLIELVECDYTSGTHLYSAQYNAKQAIRKALNIHNSIEK